MSDPRNTSTRMTEPKNSNTIYYVIAAVVLAAIAIYLYTSSTTGNIVAPTTSEAPAATETPSTAPAATPAPDAATPAEPAPTATTPATPPVTPPATPPATTPAAPANP